jgi:long-subunit fatty acid transport protein
MFKRTFLFVLLTSSLAFAAGFEKSTIQSGRYMGIGGAANSSVAGAESLYFNPAGLINGKSKNSAVFNLSPVKIDFKAPNARANQSESSEGRYGAPFALAYSNMISDQWAYGVGTYTSGGNLVEYNQVGFPSALGTDFAMKPDVFTKLAIQEFAAGVGYKVSDNLRVGAAWRGGMAMVDQSLVATTVGNTAIINPQYRQLNGWNLLGYRLGLQYDVNENWGIGMGYRNAMHLAPTGKLVVKAQTALGVNSESAESDMSVKTQLPQQFTLSSHYKCSENWTFYGQYDWTNYGAVDRLIYEGSYTTAITGAGTLKDQYVGWSDQHNLRIASQYSGFSMPIRSAFVYTTRVSSNNFATSTLAPPAPAYTLTLGTGLSMMEDALKLDGALDYTTSQGSVGSGEPLNATATTNATTKEGSYEGTAIALHMGATYNF